MHHIQKNCTDVFDQVYVNLYLKGTQKRVVLIILTQTITVHSYISQAKEKTSEKKAKAKEKEKTAAEAK